MALRFYLEDKSTNIRYDFGTVSSVSETYSVSTHSMKIPIYGFRHGYVMDLGVSKEFRLDFQRISPKPYNDTTRDSETWCNATWQRAVKDIIDRWQVMNDGFALTIEGSSGDKELYPDLFGQNVYLKQITFPRSDAKPDMIDGSVTVAVGSITGNSEPGDVPQARFNFRANFQGADPTSFNIGYPIGANYIVPRPRSAWVQAQLENAKVFKCWRKGNSELMPGQSVTIGNEIVDGDILNAVWLDAVVTPYLEAGDYEHTLQEDTTRFYVYLMGAGGGGDNGYMELNLPQTGYGGAGGGGGGMDWGQYYTEEVGTTFTVHVGEGGAGGTASDPGRAGGDTTIDGLPLVGAGGGGGDGGTPGAGGDSTVPGYDGGMRGWELTGSDTGQAPQPGGGDRGGQVETNAGAGVSGAGGGSPGYDGVEYVFTLLNIDPRGGDGGQHRGMTDSSPGHPGTYGGGGGGGAVYNATLGAMFQTEGGRGGDGFAMIMEFSDDGEGS